MDNDDKDDNDDDGPDENGILNEYAHQHEAGEGRRRNGRTGRSQTTRRSFWYHRPARLSR